MKYKKLMWFKIGEKIPINAKQIREEKRNCWVYPPSGGRYKSEEDYFLYEVEVDDEVK